MTIEKKKLHRKKMKLIIGILLSQSLFLSQIPPPRDRRGNIHRQREQKVHELQAEDDDFFRIRFRLFKNDFYSLVNLIKPVLETRYPEMAILSSGSKLYTELLLAGTLRYLAGGSYIDIVDLYHFPLTSGHDYIWKTL